LNIALCITSVGAEIYQQIYWKFNSAIMLIRSCDLISIFWGWNFLWETKVQLVVNFRLGHSSSLKNTGFWLQYPGEKRPSSERVKPHNMVAHLKGIETSFQVVPLFFKSFHFWVSYITFLKFSQNTFSLLKGK
jgi:hypothetical protein